MHISDIVRNIAVFTEILPVILYLFLRKRILVKSLWIIIVLIAIGSVTDSYSLYLFYNKKSNFLFFNVYLLIETITLYYFFSLVIHSSVFKKVLLLLSIFFTVFWVFSLIKFSNQSFFYYCINFENISILAIAVFYYYEQIIIINSAFIYAESVFWIVTAYFIYIAGTFFLYLYIPAFDSAEQKDYYDILNAIFTIIRTMLLCVAILLKPGYSKIDSKNLI